MNDNQLKTRARRMLRLIGVELGNFKADYENVYRANTNHGGQCHLSGVHEGSPYRAVPSSKPITSISGAFWLQPAMHNNGPSTDPETSCLRNTLLYMFEFLFPAEYRPMYAPQNQLEQHVFEACTHALHALGTRNIVLHVYDVLTLYGKGPDAVPCDGTISRVCSASKELRHLNSPGLEQGIGIIEKIHDFAAKHAVPSTHGFEPVSLVQLLHLGVINRRYLAKIQVTPENLHHDLEKVLRTGCNVVPTGLRKLYNEECATQTTAQRVVVFLGVAQAGWYWRGSWRSFLHAWITKCSEARPALAGQPDVPAKQLPEFAENTVFNELDRLDAVMSLQTKPPGFKLWTRSKRAAWLRKHVRVTHKVPV